MKVYFERTLVNLQLFWNFTQNLSLIESLLDSVFSDNAGILLSVFSDNAGISAIEIEDGLSSAQLRIHIHTEQCSVNMGILLSCFYVYVFLNLCSSVLWCLCMYIVQDSSARLRMYMGIQLIGFWCQIGTWGPEPTKHVAHSVGTLHTEYESEAITKRKHKYWGTNKQQLRSNFYQQ